MSIALMTLAFKTSLPTTPKFVLVALADAANDQGECYPSVAVLMAKCSLSDRGVQRALAQIEAAGHLRRELRRGRSTVYWITPTPDIQSPQPRPIVTPDQLSPPNVGHHTPDIQSPPPPNIGRDTPERRSPRTVKEPSEETSGNRKRAPAPPALDRPDDVTEATWRDWCGLRKAKKATVSETVVSGAREEAGKAGMTFEAFLREWVIRGSQGLKAEWLQPHGRASPAPARGANRSQAEIDSINARNNEETRRLLFGNQETIDG